MKKTLLALAMAATAVTAAARTEIIKSPDGKLAVAVSDDGGKATYTVTLNGVQFLAPSQLGLVMDYADLSQGLAISDTKINYLDETYSVPTIKQRDVHYVATEMVMTLTCDGKPAFDIQWRVSNRDVAFRYNVAQPRNGFHAAVVKDEVTSFTVAAGTTTFLCPQMGPMSGFAATGPSYETHYTCDEATGKNGWGDGYVFPALFRNGDKGWMLISETGTTSAYCGCHLANVEGDRYKVAFPNVKELNGLHSSTPGLSLPASTPWRTITVGKTLEPLMTTTVAWDVVEEQYPASQKYKYGRGMWSWIIGMDSSCNYDEQKRYIDFAASMGYESLLIDALWDTQIGRERMEELVKYASSKQVGIYLWYNSNGYWNHAPQGPRGIMNHSVARKAEMKWLKRIGVRGLKIDFFGGDKQPMMQFYEDILSDANDYGLCIIFHGCTIPRGWERMYPNFVAAEAVRASENLHFGQSECDKEAFCATIHPFCRNTLGSMDFGGSTLNKHYNADNIHGTTRRTSDVFALATAIMFQSPVQHFAMSPKGNSEAPQWAVDFMKQVPTVWDEVKFISGYPGRYCVMARRVGVKWYIVGINADAKPLTLNLDLSGYNLDSHFTMYSDNAKLEGSVSVVNMNKKKIQKVTIPQNGGLVIM